MYNNKAIIRVKDANINQRENIILTNVNLEIEKGEFVYLIGKVGSGKTSFLKTLYAELPAIKGSIVVGEYILNTIKRSRIPYLRRKFGIIFQDFQLLTDRNVYHNLEFVLKSTGWKKQLDIDLRIKQVLDKVGMMHKKDKNVFELSGGEQQRIGIARALLNSPDIILADEPTGNLDPETANEIFQLLKSISETGCTVLIATHQHGFMDKYKGRVLNFDNGIITEIKA